MAPNKNGENVPVPHLVDPNGTHHFSNARAGLDWWASRNDTERSPLPEFGSVDSSVPPDAVSRAEHDTRLLPEFLHRMLGALSVPDHRPAPPKELSGL